MYGHGRSKQTTENQKGDTQFGNRLYTRSKSFKVKKNKTFQNITAKTL